MVNPLQSKRDVSLHHVTSRRRLERAGFKLVTKQFVYSTRKAISLIKIGKRGHAQRGGHIIFTLAMSQADLQRYIISPRQLSYDAITFQIKQQQLPFKYIFS